MIQIIIMLAAALLPAILLWLYIWRRDARPEPTNWLRRAVIYGVLISIPVVAVEEIVMEGIFNGEPTSMVESTFQAFFVAALPEEGFKLLALWLLLRKNPYFDEHFDGIVYAVSVGLGFAALENVLYIFTSPEWLSVAVTRALLAVPGHYAFAVLMGYYYSIYHFVDHSRQAAVRVLLIPVLAHGIYDSIAFSGAINPYLGGASSLLLIFFCVRMHRYARTKVMEQIDRDKYMVG